MVRQAVIPAAGRGARLDRPGTPKPLVDVGGQPMIVRLIRQFCAVGVEKIVIIVGFEGRKVKRVLGKYDFSARMVFVENTVWERGIASSVAAAAAHVSERFLLAMADHVFDTGHVETVTRADVGADEGVALVETRKEAVFSLDTAVKVSRQDDRIVRMARALIGFDAVDAGLFSLPASVFDAMARCAPADDLADGLAPLIAHKRLVARPITEGAVDDVDTPAALVHAEMRLRKAHRIRNVARPVAAPTAPRSRVRTFDYTPRCPTTAKMVMGRGVVSDPSRLQLIPDDAASSPVFVFTDETVAGLYGRPFTAELRKRGYDVHLIVLPVGETAKSLTSYAFWVERVLSLGVDERSRFISLGGGVVCNVCGFVASTIYRGLALVHIPTTLMSQCDAAISHKQGINGHQGKNLVGTYYTPELVAVDVETLGTLPERLINDGMAEVVKHAIGRDAGYVDFLLSNPWDPRDLDFMEQVVEYNIRHKCALAAADPKELREGMILQYGHTVGHAIEHLSGYRLYHGESVAVGMAVAARVARVMGACDETLVALHHTLLEKYSLPRGVPASIRVGDVLDALRFSKKYLTEGTRMALLSGVGELWSVDGDFAIPVSCGVLAEALALTREE